MTCIYPLHRVDRSRLNQRLVTQIHELNWSPQNHLITKCTIFSVHQERSKENREREQERERERTKEREREKRTSWLKYHISYSLICKNLFCHWPVFGACLLSSLSHRTLCFFLSFLPSFFLSFFVTSKTNLANSIGSQIAIVENIKFGQLLACREHLHLYKNVNRKNF